MALTNPVVDPHSLGSHSYACMKRGGCIHGIDISHTRPWLLDAEEKVEIANQLWARISPNNTCRGLPVPHWKLGDHCWYKPKEKK